MTVAERMRRDGWVQCAGGWRGWFRMESGLGMYVYDGKSRSAEVVGSQSDGIGFTAFVPPITSDSTKHGVRHLAQRAKAAARKLARQRRA